MLPFTEYVHPETGRKQRVSWNRDRANAKCQEFRQEAIDYFRKLDIERAKAVGVILTEGTTVLPTCSFTADGVFDIDPIASKIKHSGAAVNDRWMPRWQEFCSKPQNCEDAEYAMVTHKPKEGRPAIQPVQEPPTRTIEEIRGSGKRGPGRPRRQALNV